MVSSAAKTIDAYLAELPPERRAVIAAMRDRVNAHLPPGYEETMNWGMITWQIPLARYPITYNKQPLAYVALAAQKNNQSRAPLSSGYWRARRALGLPGGISC